MDSRARRSRSPAEEVSTNIESQLANACMAAPLSASDLWHCNYFCNGNVQRCWREFDAASGECRVRWDCLTMAEHLAAAGIDGGPNEAVDPYFEIPTLALTRLCELVPDFPGVESFGGSACEVEGRDCAPPHVNAVPVARLAIPNDGLLSSTTDTVVIKDASAAEEKVLLSAWSLLRTNEDILRYALCISTGRESSGDCVANRINRTWARVQLRAVDTIDRDVSDLLNVVSAFAGPDTTGGYMQLARDGILGDAVDALNTGEPDQLLCRLLDLAATIFHELMHICGRELGLFGGRHDQHVCDKAYKAENTFRWAASQRYPTLADTCCYMWSHDCTFNYDASGITRC